MLRVPRFLLVQQLGLFNTGRRSCCPAWLASSAFGLLMTGAALAAMPVLIIYIAAQRYIVQSVASSGVKG